MSAHAGTGDYYQYGICASCGRYHGLYDQCPGWTHPYIPYVYQETTPSVREPWTCPVCNRGLAWWVSSCDHGGDEDE